MRYGVNLIEEIEGEEGLEGRGICVVHKILVSELFNFPGTVGARRRLLAEPTLRALY